MKSSSWDDRLVAIGLSNLKVKNEVVILEFEAEVEVE